MQRIEGLVVGFPAPRFPFLEHVRGKRVVLFFYPKDFSKTCTTELLGFERIAQELHALNTTVVGVNLDSASRHQRFQQSFPGTTTLLTDETGEIISAYHAWNVWKCFGHWSGALRRMTYIIDEEGRIRRIWRKVRVARHAEEVLAFVQQLSALKKTLPNQLISISTREEG